MLSANKIRQIIYDVVTKNGGHLSSNLGIVDLVLAIHQTYDLTKTNLVFDVGHQCYAHKILTKRDKDFATLRTPHGLSGFINPSESQTDLFELGHGGSALSIGIGLAIGNPNKKTVVITGDGSFVNPLTLGALNLLDKVTNLLVIINNNKFSISPASGNVWTMLNSYDEAKKFFETLKCNFIYEPKGNDVKSVVAAINKCNSFKTPTFLLVDTIKGYGKPDVEADCNGVMHAVLPQHLRCSKTWTTIVSENLLNFIKNSKQKVYVIQAGMTIGTSMLSVQSFLKERYIDTQMNEEAAVGIAMGIKKANPNAIVILSFYATFMQRAYDQLINDLARFSLPILILVNRVGLIDADGPTHQGLYLNQMFSGIDNYDLYYPSNAMDFLNKLNDFSSVSKKHLVIGYSKEKYDDDLILPTRGCVEGDTVIMGYGVLFNELVTELMQSKTTSLFFYNTHGPHISDTAFLDTLISKKCSFITIEEMIKPGSLYEFMLEYLSKKRSTCKLDGMYVTKKDVSHNTRKHLLEINKLTLSNLLKLLN